MSGGNWSLLLIGNDTGVWNRKELVLGKIWLWILLWMWDGRGAKSCHLTARLRGAGCSLPEVKRECWRLEWVDVLQLSDVWMYTLSSHSTCWKRAAGTLTDGGTEKSIHSREAADITPILSLTHALIPKSSLELQRTFSLPKISYRDGHCNQYFRGQNTKMVTG